ncbi:MAG: hypothetical protein Q8J71_07100 [Brevundimonas sp.]|nr:hypothetical protein [Brevundimonas sp.]
MPALAANLPELGALGGGGRPANLEALAALKPPLVIDYGDTDPGNRQLGDRMRDRLGVEWRLIDGALPRIPEAIREAAVLLDATRSAAGLADEAAMVLDRWRRAPPGPPARILAPDHIRALFGVEVAGCPCCGQALS